MPKTQPIPRDQESSSGKEAAALLRLNSGTNSAPAKSAKSNGNSAVGGRKVSGGANVNGGQA
jgi:hypothetical protein